MASTTATSRIFKEDLERIEELFEDVDSEKRGSKKDLRSSLVRIYARTWPYVHVQLYGRVQLVRRYWTNCAKANTISWSLEIGKASPQQGDSWAGRSPK